MSTFSKELLSGTPASGRPLLINATTTLGDVVHTTLASPTLDEVWLYASNADSQDRTLTIEFGGAADPDDLIDAMTIGFGVGLVTVVPGLILTGTLVITAFAEVADQINIFGFVNRITA